MTTVPLTQGLVALVDDADVSAVIAHRWRAQRVGRLWYAVRNAHRDQWLMHRLLLGLLRAPHTVTVDHVSGDGLDNRRANLRVATKAEQVANSPSHAGGTSRYKGVSAHGTRWRMAIVVAGVQTARLFDDEQAAARAYNVLAERAWGPFARLNDV